MESFEDIIIGFGKGGKTLAGALASAGRRVALIERDAGMYGGTCINVACIPTKSLEYSARMSAAQGGAFAARAERYRLAVEEKRRLTGMLRAKNLAKVESAGVTVLTGAAAFLDPHRVRVTFADGTVTEVFGGRFFLNTGARPFIPPIPGLAESRHMVTSETLMERDALPRRLAIIGGGYIGLEFASYFANFGSEVAVIQDGGAFIPREDEEVARAVHESLVARGIRVLTNAAVLSVQDAEDGATLSLTVEGTPMTLAADAILVATGRRPNVAGLALDKAGVRLTERGAVETDEHLCTSAPHIYAMGDVAGGLQFTYISLDDFRIVRSTLAGDGSRTTKNRGAVPYTVFLDPPLSRVGLTEKEAVAQGYAVKVARLPAAAIPKAHILKRPTGLLKAIVDADTGRILGAHLFCIALRDSLLFSQPHARKRRVEEDRVRHRAAVLRRARAVAC